MNMMRQYKAMVAHDMARDIRAAMAPGTNQRFCIDGSIALLARAGLATSEERLSLNQNSLRGYALLDIAAASLEQSGVNTSSLSSMEIVARAFAQGTSDFPVILENALNKALIAAYETQPDTWSRFCARGSLSDFREHNRYRTGTFGTLDTVPENSEYKNKRIPDGEKSTITAATKGNIISITRRAVINDDLSAFMALATSLGRAGRRTVESDVHALLGQNSGAGPLMGDGFALFSTEHGNLAGSGAAPSVPTISAGRVAMASQRDLSGNEYLDIRPHVWVGPMATGGVARVVNGAVYDPDAEGSLQRPNAVAGLFNDIVDSPRIATSFWYMFADANAAPVIEVAFLNGKDQPYTERRQNFSTDSIDYKVRLDYGVAVVDYRGGYANPGA